MVLTLIQVKHLVPAPKKQCKKIKIRMVEGFNHLKGLHFCFYLVDLMLNNKVCKGEGDWPS